MFLFFSELWLLQEAQWCTITRVNLGSLDTCSALEKHKILTFNSASIQKRWKEIRALIVPPSQAPLYWLTDTYLFRLCCQCLRFCSLADTTPQIETDARYIRQANMKIASKDIQMNWILSNASDLLCRWWSCLTHFFFSCSHSYLQCSISHH